MRSNRLVWLAIAVLTIGLTGAFYYGMNTFIKEGYLPQSRVLEGREMPAGQIELLRKMEILEPGETVIYFYSAGLWSILEDGNMLTDRRIISYEAGDAFSFYEAKLEEVSHLEVMTKGSTLVDTVVEVMSGEVLLFRLFLSTERKGDELFLKKARRLIGNERAIMSTPVTKPADPPAQKPLQRNPATLGGRMQ